MKKVFTFLFASALLVTALVSCGGGGGDTDEYAITAKRFRAGYGVGFMMASNLEILANSNGEFGVDGSSGNFDMLVPTEKDGTVDYENHTYTQVGKDVHQERTVKAGSANFPAKVRYRETTENVGFMDLSFDDYLALNDHAITSGLGMLLGSNEFVGGGDRNNIESMEGCAITIALNFSTHQAQILITATGVHYKDEEGNDIAGIQLGPYSSASPIPFYPIRP